MTDIGSGRRKVLFVSGSGGLGHVTRDLAIAEEMRRTNPNIDVVWLSEEPATSVLREAGEKILPEASMMFHGNRFESLEEDWNNTYDFDLFSYSRKMSKNWAENAEVILRVVEREKPDLMIGDEAYDLTFRFFEDENARTTPFIMIYDFIGVDPVTKRPVDFIAARYFNKKFVQFLTGRPKKIADRFLFVGTLDDIRDKAFGLFLPNRREIVRKHAVILGYVLPFDPKGLEDVKQMKRSLGYAPGPLVICTKGGTQVGKPFLGLCAKAYPIIKRRIPDVQMVIVCGPGIDPKEVVAPDGVTVKGYVPQLYRHLACADFCITQAGGTTTLELTALQKPFAYLPLEKQWEQLNAVSDRCKRLHAGIEMRFYETTPEILAKVVIDNIGKQVKYDLAEVDGARRAAEEANRLLAG